MEFKDQLGRNLRLDATPKRIVSLVPSQTELLVDLGLESSIVGVTKFCIHPSHLRTDKTVVGGTKSIKIEKIKGLRPDIVLCNKEENTKEIIAQLKDIAPIHISDVLTITDALELITMYGNLFNVETKSNGIIKSILQEQEAFKKAMAFKPSKKVAYFIWRNPWMVAASDSFINDMLNEAGFDNVFRQSKRYPEIELGNRTLEEAEYLFLSSEPFPFKEKHAEELKKLFPSKTIKIVDGELFSWYGSRLIQSYKYFKALNL